MTAIDDAPIQMPSALIRRVLRLPVHAFRNTVRFFRDGIYVATGSIPYFKFVLDTRDTPVPRTFRMWFLQKIIGINRGPYWPVHFTSKVNQWQNISVGIHTCPGYEPGCYIQGLGRLYMGDYTIVAQNVGIISANHDIYNSMEHDKSAEVRIGSYCWLGMNSIVLPGTELGDFTVVGAGSVVTKSFPDGYVVIAGNPAVVIRTLDPNRCVRFTYASEYRGYIRADKFEKWKKWRLWV